MMNSTTRATIGGLSRGSSRGHIVRATLEGVAHRVVDVADTIWGDNKPSLPLRTDGGASRNDFLMQLQADLLGIPVQRSAQADGSALGVAMLAACGVGLEDDRATTWIPERVFEPSLSNDERASLRNRWAEILGQANLGVF